MNQKEGTAKTGQMAKLTGMIKALLIANLISVLFLLLLAFLLWKLELKEGQVQAGIAAAYLVSCFFGGRKAGNSAEKRKFFWGMLLGILYFLLLLLISACFLKGDFAATGKLIKSALFCAAGGMLGGMSCKTADL